MPKKLLILLFLFCSIQIFSQKYESYKKIADTTISSLNLGYNKNISVIVPKDWQQNIEKKYPLTIIFDRQNKRSNQFIINTIDYLTINDQMPASIIVSVDSEQMKRTKETLHKKTNSIGMAQENELFIFNELIPFIEKNYKASKFRVLIGHSRYGYLTTYLFEKRLNQLNAVISLSPFFTTQKNINLTDSIIKVNSYKGKQTKYYRYGIGNDFPKEFEIMEQSLKLLDNEFINAKGILLPEAYHNVTPGLIAPLAIYEVFEYWSKQVNLFFDISNKNINQLEIASKNIENHYGEKLRPSIGILNGKGWEFYNDKEYQKAIAIWEVLLTEYPNYSEGYLNIIWAQEELKL
ncbi:MAG: putative alpha/beta superfamily hydrolase, partial [Polaribacter sp.]